jgi:hypothetical protein
MIGLPNPLLKLTAGEPEVCLCELKGMGDSNVSEVTFNSWCKR